MGIEAVGFGSVGLTDDSRDGFPTADPMGSVLSVQEGVFRRDSHLMQDGCGIVLGRDRIAAWIGGVAIALTIDKAFGDSSTGENTAVAIGPMLSTCIGSGDLRFASKLAHPSDDGIVEHSSCFEIFDQRRECRIGRWDQVVF